VARLPLALAVASLLLVPVSLAGGIRLAPRTSLHLFSPFAHGAPAAGVAIAKTVNGSCWTGSSETARATAFRCLVGNEILDPCFASAATDPLGYVLCPQPRPGSPLVRITLTGALPANPVTGSPTRYAPWAVETARGNWCELATGANGTIDGLPVSYSCGAAGFLLGEPERAHALWTIQSAADANSQRMLRIPLRSAWW
jgi:hypothetical protein